MQSLKNKDHKIQALENIIQRMKQELETMKTLLDIQVRIAFFVLFSSDGFFLSLIKRV